MFRSFKRSVIWVGLAFFAMGAARPLWSEEAADYESEAYNVSGKKSGATGSRMNVPATDVPATVNVISSDDLRKTGANDWTSALRYTAGLMPLFTYGGFNSATVRGMQENDLVVLLDGIRDDTYNLAWSSPQTNLTGYQSIEVLKGPNSMLYGTGALAGVINRVRKQPESRAAYEVKAGVGSFGARQLEFGLTGPVEGMPLSYRFDFGTTQEEGYRSSPQRRASGSLALEWKPFDQTSVLWHSSVNHDRYDHPDPGIPVDLANGRVPGNAPLDKNYGNPWDFLDFQGNYHQLQLRQGLGENFYGLVRSSFSPVDYEYLEAEALDLGPDKRTITRDYLYFTRHHRPWLTQGELGWDFKGELSNQGLAGVDHHYYKSFGERDSALDYSGYAIPTIDLYTPVETADRVQPRPDFRNTAVQRTQSVYAQDLLGMADGKLKLLAAARFDSFEKSQSSDAIDPDTQDVTNLGYVTTTTGSAVTWRGGLIYSPVKEVSIYASASTAFKPIIVTNSSDGKVDWLPETGRMFEVGAKWEGQGVSAAAAYFDILKQNVLVRRSNTPRIYTQDGERSSRGFELEGRLHLASGAGIKAGYAYVDATSSRFDIASNAFYYGRPYVVPMHTANVWLDLKINEEVSAGLGGRFVGDQYADEIANKVLMPWYAVADAGLYYQKGPWGADLTANNLLDQRNYFVSTITGNNPQLYPGNPLQLNLSGRYSF